MAKAKGGPALFDLLTKDGANASDALRVPRWWQRERGPPAITKADAEIPASQAETAPSAGPMGEWAAAPGRAPEPLPAAPPRRSPWFELDGARIRLSFTSVTAAVAFFAALVMLFGAFEVGRRSGEDAGFQRGHAAGRKWYESEMLSEIEAARLQPPATDLISSLFEDYESDAAPVAADSAAANPGNEDQPAEPAVPWARDFTYIVVQEFAAGHREDARRAQDYLEQHGVAAALVRFPSGAIQLITREGFRWKDPAQKRDAERLLKKIHRIGATYFAAGGGYRLEGYFKTLKADTW